MPHSTSPIESTSSDDTTGGTDDAFVKDDAEEENDASAKSKEWYRFIGAEADGPANKETKFGGVWTGFKDRTTAHGIPHIDKSRGEWRGFSILLKKFINVKIVR